jgi:acyl-CoA synthetase (AMP-forming)/AMP-acid ligase II
MLEGCLATLSSVPPVPETLRDVLLERAEADRDRLAYDDELRRVTFGELAELAALRSAQLAEMGVREGDRVALVLPSGIPFAEAFWGLQLLGATPCAFNPAVPAETLERRTALIRPRLVLREGDLEAAPAPSGPAPEPSLGPEDLAFLQPTSGTSGEPRAAMIRHRNVLACMWSNAEDGHIVRDDVLVNWVPPWHDLGLVRFVIACVYFGSPCHILQPAVRTIPAWLEAVGRVRGTVTAAPDFAFRLATRMVDPAQVDLSTLRYLNNGGEPPRSSTIKAFEERFGVPGRVLPGYGLAEAVLGVTVTKLGDAMLVDEHGNVSNGRPFPGIEVRIDGDGSEPGEILVRGDVVFAGYFDSIEESHKALRDGWLHTGDVGYLDADGNLFVLGRSRSMIKRGGGVVASRELEEAAQEVDDVRVAAAVSLPAASELNEPIVVAVETSRQSTRPANTVAAEVSRSIVARAGFAPARVVVVPPATIPRTANGKLRHSRLRELVLDGFIDAAAAGGIARASAS